MTCEKNQRRQTTAQRSHILSVKFTTMSQRRPKVGASTSFKSTTSSSTVASSTMAAVGPGAFELDGSSPTAAASATKVSETHDGPDKLTKKTALSTAAQTHMTRLQKWKESPFACALTEPTWQAEALRQAKSNPAYTQVMKHQQHPQHRGRTRVPLSEHEADNDEMMIDEDDELTEVDMHPDTTGCLCCSAMVCPLVGAGRVGNMAVLRSTTERVEEIEEDLETGGTQVRKYTRPKLLCVLGPYWPMLLFVTYPLILGVSAWAFRVAIAPGNKPFIVVLGWFALTMGLIVALALTGCRDPGILYRYSDPPPQNENNWRWNDQALTYRPRGAHFDTDTAVVVEEFDHTCPWTGTAIGKKNMLSFQFFVCLVFICLIMDIFLITGAV